VLVSKDASPIAILLEAVVLAVNAPLPTATLLPPVVLVAKEP